VASIRFLLLSTNKILTKISPEVGHYQTEPNIGSGINEATILPRILHAEMHCFYIGHCI
jgi:hypothetical protein